MKRLAMIALAAVLALGLAPTPGRAAATGTLQELFPDARLAQGVYDKLAADGVAWRPASVSAGTVTDAQLATVSGHLNLSNYGIADLTGIGQLSAITGLSLDGNAITALPAGVFDPLTALATLN
ncbi:MAG: hypothetical protein LBQ92_03395, partial [Propionibacteriaceae bacterium]|nr:hypothetical protein [Propionibacteriaceae bacterium]